MDPLSRLNQNLAVSFKRGTYLSSQLTQAKTKKIRLDGIYKLICQRVVTNSNDGTLSNSDKIKTLNKIEEIGNKYYHRYQNVSKRLTRRFLRFLPLITPTFLKKYLPSCFSNKIVLAEKNTKKEYEIFVKCLGEQKTLLNNKIPEKQKSKKLKKKKKSFKNDIVKTNKDKFKNLRIKVESNHRQEISILPESSTLNNSQNGTARFKLSENPLPHDPDLQEIVQLTINHSPLGQNHFKSQLETGPFKQLDLGPKLEA